MSGGGGQSRQFNGIPILAYWEIVKNYYANKQETNAYVIHSQPVVAPQTLTGITIDGDTIVQRPSADYFTKKGSGEIILTFSAPPTMEMLENILLNWNTAGTNVSRVSEITSGAEITGSTIKARALIS